MQDLRLIGVHEDGHHLLLADADGGRFRLPLDEPLRAAARRDRPRLGQLQIEMEGGMRPREVQSLIRRGLSAEEVADRSGWSVEKVRRFEGPILAEREHVARVASACAVGTRGPAPVSLAERVSERLRDRGVERDDIEWDSARDEEGVWQVSMTFAAGGRRRTATWHYEPLGGSVSPTNDEARWLSEDSASGLIPTPHRTPTPDDLDVYDVDADGGIERSTEVVRAVHEPIDLMAAMREHSARGRRSKRRSPSHTPGEDRPREDALPIEELAGDLSQAGPPPAARARKPVAEHLEEPTRSRAMVGGWPEDDGSQQPETDAAPRATGSDDRTASGSRRGRRSVPSWDDIVFGTKGSGPS
ncbi:septation protein SepH [Phycicoccus avicenniae]|uniref:septation protein SepH n=1 Tax=Phycicoccus avicenniae TaxID=2828860 RepID=UPI003D2E254B